MACPFVSRTMNTEKKKLNLKVKSLEKKTAPKNTCRCATSPVIGAS